jgi:TolA-binding protein/peroxiredoxin
MMASSLLCSLLFASLVAAPARAVDAESDAWTAAMALEQTAAANLGQPIKFGEARVAFEAFAKAYPSSARVKEAESEAAWCAAMQLKGTSKYTESAAAFDAFAKNYPTSPHFSDAFVEGGVAWYALARSKQTLHRNTPDSMRDFNTALQKFDKIAVDKPADPSAGRAQFMRGSTHILMGDLKSAESDFGTVIEKYKDDKKYYGKALERRSAVRRHLLQTDSARSDLQRYQKEVGDGGEEAEIVKRYFGYTQMFGKPAPPLDAESWIQGDPTTLEKLRGDVVVLYFFATWCPNCAKEKDHVLDVVARYEPMGVKFIGVITHSQGTTAETARPFLASNAYNFPVIMDRGTTVGAYQSSKIPDMVLIDRSGKVRWHDNPANFLESTLETLLVEDVAAPSSAKSH